jgi:hypothetical protein
LFFCLFFVLVLFFRGTLFDSTGVWNKDILLSRQALYHLNHAPSSFVLVYFSDRVLLLPEAVSCIVGIMSVWHHVLIPVSLFFLKNAWLFGIICAFIWILEFFF